MKKLILLLGFILSLNIVVIAQEGKTVDSREYFLSTRIKNPTTNTNKVRIAHKPIHRPTKKATTIEKSDKKDVMESANEPIGLGYTLYLRDEKDNGIRVDPEREFKSGDAVRLALEPSIEGYLYIFYVENEESPELLYPDARLNAGDNTVKAHVPYEIPSRTAKDPNLRWFFFSGEPAKEKLYVMVTKSPLPQVPTGAALVKYYQENKTTFKPSSETWAIVKAKADEPNLISKSNDYGQKQTDVENSAINRKLSLGNSAPAPSTIKVSRSSNTDAFATIVELKHN